MLGWFVGKTGSDDNSRGGSGSSAMRRSAFETTSVVDVHAAPKTLEGKIARSMHDLVFGSPLTEESTREEINERLYDAAYAGDRMTVLDAIFLGGEPFACNEAGNCSVHAAAAGGHARVLELLLRNEPQKGASLKNNKGNTPLHMVAGRQQLNDSCVECVAILLNSGADSIARNRAGISPRAMIRDKGLAATKIAELLDQTVLSMCSWLAHAPGAGRGEDPTGSTDAERSGDIPFVNDKSPIQKISPSLSENRIEDEDSDIVHFDPLALAAKLKAEEAEAEPAPLVFRSLRQRDEGETATLTSFPSEILNSTETPKDDHVGILEGQGEAGLVKEENQRERFALSQSERMTTEDEKGPHPLMKESRKSEEGYLEGMEWEQIDSEAFWEGVEDDARAEDDDFLSPLELAHKVRIAFSSKSNRDGLSTTVLEGWIDIFGEMLSGSGGLTESDGDLSQEEILGLIDQIEVVLNDSKKKEASENAIHSLPDKSLEDAESAMRIDPQLDVPCSEDNTSDSLIRNKSILPTKSTTMAAKTVSKVWAAAAPTLAKHLQSVLPPSTPATPTRSERVVVSVNRDPERGFCSQFGKGLQITAFRPLSNGALGPLEDAGVRLGDRLVRIGFETVADKSLSETMQALSSVGHEDQPRVELEFIREVSL